MSRQDALRVKSEKLKEIKVTIPPLFENKRTYMMVLYQILKAEEKVDRLNTEVIAEEKVDFVFEEILEIYCRIRMRVPKTIQQHIT